MSAPTPRVIVADNILQAVVDFSMDQVVTDLYAVAQHCVAAAKLPGGFPEELRYNFVYNFIGHLVSGLPTRSRRFY